MAINATPGHGRVGRIKKRVQSYNPFTKQYVKSNTETGRFVNVKDDGTPFKSVRRYKTKG